MRLTSCLLAVALMAPVFAHAEQPVESDLGRAVAEMPMPSLERTLKARAVASKLIRRTARVMGLADNELQRTEILLAQNNRSR